MKKIYKVLVFFLFILFFSGSSYFVNNFEGKDFILAKEINGYRFTLKKFDYEIFNGYLKLNVKGMFKTSNYGYPELPSYRFLIKTKNKHFSIKNIKISLPKKVNIDIPSKGIFPLQKPVIKSKPSNEFYIDERFYSSLEKFPNKVVDLKFLGKMKNDYIFQIEINPFLYDRGENKLYYFDTIFFNTENEEFNLLDSKEYSEKKYLIVVNSQMKTFLNDFIDLKKKEGFLVDILLLDTIGSTKEEIKNGILNVYNNSSVMLEYVLLVGDVDIIPNYVGTEQDNPSTDLYYSTLSDSDFLPDVGIGRFPVQDTTSLKGMLEKNIKYQYSLFENTNYWTKKAYFMASDDANFHQVAESTHLYVMNKLKNISVETDSLFYYYNSGTPVSTAINNGRALAIYSGHGDVTLWAGPSFSNSDILSLTNGDMLPFVSSFACLTGNYAYSDDCFGETWVKKIDGGSISFLGSSVYSYWDEDDIMERGFFDYYVDSNYTNISELVYLSKLSVLNVFPSTGKRYFEQYNLFGDPSLEFYTALDSLYTDLPSSIPSSTYSLDLYVYDKTTSLPLEDVRVSLILKDSLMAVGKTDPDGKVSFNLVGNVDDTLKFYAFKNNYIPDSSYTVIINSNFYPYIENFLIQDNFYNFNQPDGNFTSADSGEIFLTVQNKGTDTIFSLSCSLFTFDDNIKLYSYILDFKDTIAPSDTSKSNNSVLFKVKDDVKNNTYDSIGFKFFNNDTNLIFKKKFFITSPETKIDSVAINSSNLNLFSYDTFNFVIKLKNYSSEKDRKINLSLVSLDTSLVKISPDYFYFDSLSGESSIVIDTFKGFVQNIDSFAFVNIKVKYLDTLGLSDSFIKVIYLNKKDYLVLDYSDSSFSSFFIDSILKSWGYKGDNVKTIDRELLKNYNYIFLIAGSYPNNNVISSSDPVVLKIDSLLKNGHIKLYVEGGEIFYWDPSYSNGYNFNLLCHTDPKNDGSSTSPSIFYGLDGSIGDGINLEYDTSNYLDIIDTIDGSKRVFYNETSTYVVSYKTDKYRTIASSFEFGNIVDVDSLSSKSGWLKRIIDFFELRLGLDELLTKKRSIGMGDFKVLSISKNIVDKKIDIKFYSKDKKNIDLKLYDVSGRIVYNERILLDAGENTYHIDLSLKNFASGLYFLKIYSNLKTEFLKKMVFLK